MQPAVDEDGSATNVLPSLLVPPPPMQEFPLCDKRMTRRDKSWLLLLVFKSSFEQLLSLSLLHA